MTFPILQVPLILKCILGKSRVLPPDTKSSASSSFWEVTEKRAEEARSKGYPLRSFFPHQFYFLPKCGPDGLKLAQRMCGVEILFIEPGSLWENGYHESFNGKLRDELLNGEIFYTFREAKVLIEGWRQQYKHIRPHSSLGYKPPAPEARTPVIAIPQCA